MSAAAGVQPRGREIATSRWPLLAIVALAAVLRLATLGSQSLWFDEAFTAVHTLHPSLTATLSSMVHTENSPFLWYVLEWLDYRALGMSEVALRLPSAIAGIATVPFAWGVGRELAGRRAAIVCALLVAVGPLFVWYSQEARVYALYALLAAVATYCFLRLLRLADRRAAIYFTVSAALCLMTHYFAVFLLAPMCVWLIVDRRMRRFALPVVGVIVLVGLALIPLVHAQGGHFTQWIGRWPLAERTLAVAQYWLLGESGAPLGHAVELLVALPVLIGTVLWLARALRRPPAVPAGEIRGALTALAICAPAILVPILLAAVGIDYLTPRNLIGAMIPFTGLVAVMLGSASTGAAGVACAAGAVIAMLAVTLDVNVNHRLQRGDWRGLAAALPADPATRAITAAHLATTPLQYYLPQLHVLPSGHEVDVSEIDEVGYAPIRPGARTPPAPGFSYVGAVDAHGMIAYRFRAPSPRPVPVSALLAHPLMPPEQGEAAEVLVSPRVRTGG
ncbi:MAG TPA: glycosyltransferase family 39 protein [Solirubrobacteraceae bacterium]|nr:glycosyltransferase family 39 protein [Solirubrobacteraceae bacterium]